MFVVDYLYVYILLSCICQMKFSCCKSATLCCQNSHNTLQCRQQTTFEATAAAPTMGSEKEQKIKFMLLLLLCLQFFNIFHYNAFISTYSSIFFCYFYYYFPLTPFPFSLKLHVAATYLLICCCCYSSLGLQLLSARATNKLLQFC